MERLGVTLIERVAVAEPVGVTDGVVEDVGVTDDVEVGDTLRVAIALLEAVILRVAAAVTEPVGEVVGSTEREAVLLGVGDGENGSRSMGAAASILTDTEVNTRSEGS